MVKKDFFQKTEGVVSFEKNDQPEIQEANIAENVCKNCKKLFSNKYNLKRHNDICINKKVKNLYKCEYCEDIFSRNYLLIQHIIICKCKRYKDKIDELEKIIIDLKLKINSIEDINNINISEEDININLFSIYDILEYGKSIGLFICIQNSNILKKIKIKSKKKKYIKYNINNQNYKDDGLCLIQYILNLLKNQIINIINDKFSIITDKDILHNNHIKRILNIKNIEIDEIINENKKNNLYEEIYTTIFEYL
jgi:hypothetical protein